MSFYFIIVADTDIPIYEFDVDTTINSLKNPSYKPKEDRQLAEFIIHSSLDLIEQALLTRKNMYLKVVDKFNKWSVSSFVSAANTKFVLLHELKNDDLIGHFFTEVYSLYTKVVLNSLYELKTPIKSSAFDAKIKGLVKKYFFNNPKV